VKYCNCPKKQPAGVISHSPWQAEGGNKKTFGNRDERNRLAGEEIDRINH